MPDWGMIDRLRLGRQAPVQDPPEFMGAGPPAFCTLHSTLCIQIGRILQSKGFAGGVPLNTERTTVKPWVGI